MTKPAWTRRHRSLPAPEDSVTRFTSKLDFALRPKGSGMTDALAAWRAAEGRGNSAYEEVLEAQIAALQTALFALSRTEHANSPGALSADETERIGRDVMEAGARSVAGWRVHFVKKNGELGIKGEGESDKP